MKTASLASLVALNTITHAQTDAISMPIRILYGPLSKVTTPVLVGSGNEEIGQSIEVVVDYGSADFWVFAPNATVNYGSQYLGFTGACNTSPSYYYHLDNVTLANFTGSYSYGGNSKILEATHSVNDTLYFSSSPAIPNIEIALVSSGIVRQYVPDGQPCPELSYDYGIMGLCPSTSNDNGPNLKTNLLNQGRISASVASMYFSPPPADASITYNFTGTLLLGALPPADSYTGELIPVPITTPVDGSGYYVSQPVISHANTSIPTDYPTETCLVDSGSLSLTLPYASNNTAFFASTGFQDYENIIVYPSNCEDIPRDLKLDFEFAGSGNASVSVSVPYRYLARGSSGPGGVTPEGMCVMSVAMGSGCTFGAPWFLGASVGADDGEKVVWMAQGVL
ncbi:putative pepsin b-like protein [Botrytis fragariae]|uniref:Putative pepsin b-like protein n=1 Tax=Botrytis fragariae TaxID=1964551 RepID=A0A8H6ARH3_9HELO|nr:putative pepsin b-like protein [Botrytis fragariae]KAF5872272.1 putative pepsin b-like protein [Botrytis fragariae]